MFKVNKIHLGIIRVGSKSKIRFAYTDILNIITMASPCDCATPINNVNSKEVIVEYTAKDVPKHLQLKGESQYPINKEISVTYTKLDGTQAAAKLVFTATVTNHN